jgi:hypothetical protein
MSTINGAEIQKMVGHWLGTPVEGYLGSDYGQDAQALLQMPHSDRAPDDFLDKLRADVPVINMLPPGSANLYSIQTAPDRLDLVIEVAGQIIEIPNNAN